MGGDRERVFPSFFEATLELVGEEQIRELALTVCRLRVVSLVPVEVGEIDLADPVGHAAHVDDPRTWCVRK